MACFKGRLVRRLFCSFAKGVNGGTKINSASASSTDFSRPKLKKIQGDCHFSPTAIRILKYSVGLIVTRFLIGYAFLMLA